MKDRLTAAALVLLALTGAEPTSDRERIQGTWTIIDVQIDGAPIPEGKEQKRFLSPRLTFQGDRVISTTEDVAARFVIHQDASPQSLDIQVKRMDEEKKILYAYRLKGDDLLLCLSPQNNVRPVEVTSKKQLLMVLKRQKEEPKGK